MRYETMCFSNSGFFLMIQTSLSASHMGGGNISWEYKGGNNYVFYVTITRNCDGIPPPQSQNVLINWNGGSISTQKVKTIDINEPSGNPSGCVYQVVTYKSSNVMIRGNMIPSSGLSFQYSLCCRSQVDNMIAGDFSLQTIMHTNAKGKAPTFSTFPGSYEEMARRLARVTYTGGKHYMLFHPIKTPVGGTVMSRMRPPKTMNGSNIRFRSGYSFLNPLPDATEWPGNGPFVMDTLTGIGSYDIVSDSGSFHYNVTHEYYFSDASGKKQLLAQVENNIVHDLRYGDSSANDAPLIKVSHINDTISALGGDSLKLSFNATDIGQKVSIKAISAGLDTNYFSSAGVSKPSAFSVHSQNSSSNIWQLNVDRQELRWQPGFNHLRGPRLIPVYLMAEDSVGIGSKKAWKAIWIKLDAVVNIQSGSNSVLKVTPLCNRSLSVQTESGQVVWSPANLVGNSSALQTTFTGNTSAWVYARDPQFPGFRDSVFVDVLDSSRFDLRLQQDTLQLTNTTGLITAPEIWRYNGFPFKAGGASVVPFANGTYEVEQSVDKKCRVKDSQVVNMSSFMVGNIGSNPGTVFSGFSPNNSMGFQFDINNSGASQTTLNSVSLLGIQEIKGKLQDTGSIALRLYDNTGQLMVHRDTTLTLAPAVLTLPVGAQVFAQTDYTLIWSINNNFVMSGVIPNYPYTSPEGITFKNPIYGDTTGSMPSGSTSRIFVTALNLDINVSLYEDFGLNHRNLFPNPVKDLLHWTKPLEKFQTVELFTLDGAKRATIQLEKNSTHLSLAHLPKGLYLLKMDDTYRKIMIE